MNDDSHIDQEVDAAGRHDDECALHTALEHFGISEHEQPSA